MKAPVHLRRPYVGEGADGARRSAEIDRSEADGYDRDDPRRGDRLASAAVWERQAEWLDGWRVDAVNLAGDGPVVLAQHNDTVRWNGWVCPSLDAWSCQVVLEWLAAADDEDDLDWRWLDGGQLEVEEDIYSPDDDGLYPLGAWAWVWSRTREPAHVPGASGTIA